MRCCTIDTSVSADKLQLIFCQGYYTKKKIDRADGFVVQTGDADPAGTVHGYVPPGSAEERKIPLEISLKVSQSLDDKVYWMVHGKAINCVEYKLLSP